VCSSVVAIVEHFALRVSPPAEYGLAASPRPHAISSPARLTPNLLRGREDGGNGNGALLWGSDGLGQYTGDTKSA
jgi:hypothetical protein